MPESKKTPHKFPTHEEVWALEEARIMKEPDPEKRSRLLRDLDLMLGKPEPKQRVPQELLDEIDRNIEIGFRLQNHRPAKGDE